jgi:glycosyltransferase involved in cell wall biosynthesis
MKKNDPFVSVIIPTYNRVELLKQTVESVRCQTYSDYEIIVVNDGSTDGTANWLQEQVDIIKVNQPNSGIAASRNKGVSVGRGQWMAFLDHDDLWDHGKLQIQTDFIRSNPEVAMVAARHVRIGLRVGRSESNKWIKGDLFSKVYSESFIHTSSVMMRRDALEKIGGFPSKYRFADEFDVWLKISRDFPIAFVNIPLVFIRFYDSNTSHNRIGVRSDTYDILLNNYDPGRIPRDMYLRTLSDHDISFGRAYIGLGDLDNALKWFQSAVERTPLRPRAWRYYARYRLLDIMKKMWSTSGNA